MFNEFKKFAMQGNVVDLAVGVIIGAAFGAIVTSVVQDVVMPVVGLFTGGLDFSQRFVLYASVALAKAAGATTLNYGLFLNAVVNFLIVAFALFLVVKAMNSARQSRAQQAAAAPPTTPAPSTEVLLLTEIRDLLRGSTARP